MTKIKYNKDAKESSINELNNCIYEIDDIYNGFLQITIPNDFSNKDILDSIKIDIKKMKENISDYKNNLNRYMDNINKDELELLSKINKIENLRIDKLDL